MKPSEDFLHTLGYLGFTMRLKRISDKLMHDGRNLYQSLDFDIEPNWYGIFMLLDRYQKCSVTEIADHLQLSHPSAITIINKMEKAGYVVAEKSTSDQRKRQLKLTEQAVDRLAAYKKLWTAGAESVRQLLQETNLFSDLLKLERHMHQSGFKDRTLIDYKDQVETNKGLKIISFDEKYSDDFTRINYEWLEMYFHVEKHDREMLDAPKSYIVDQGGHIFLALLDGVVAGVVALIDAEAGVFELSKMGVSPIYKGLGIGEKLVEHALTFSKGQGKEKVILESNRKLTPALNLYRKLGFEEVRLDPDSPYQRCDIRMEIILN